MQCKFCERPGAARDMCNTHYRRWRAGATYEQLIKPIVRRLPPPPVCTEPDCETKPWARGLCRRHYQRQYVHSTPFRRTLHRLSEAKRRQRLKQQQTA